LSRRYKGPHFYKAKFIKQSHNSYKAQIKQKAHTGIKAAQCNKFLLRKVDVMSFILGSLKFKGGISSQLSLSC
jgi:hypothetical protein